MSAGAQTTRDIVWRLGNAAAEDLAHGLENHDCLQSYCKHTQSLFTDILGHVRIFFANVLEKGKAPEGQLRLLSRKLQTLMQKSESPIANQLEIKLVPGKHLGPQAASSKIQNCSIDGADLPTVLVILRSDGLYESRSSSTQLVHVQALGGAVAMHTKEWLNHTQDWRKSIEPDDSKPIPRVNVFTGMWTSQEIGDGSKLDVKRVTGEVDKHAGTIPAAADDSTRAFCKVMFVVPFVSRPSPEQDSFGARAGAVEAASVNVIGRALRDPDADLERQQRESMHVMGHGESMMKIGLSKARLPTNADVKVKVNKSFPVLIHLAVTWCQQVHDTVPSKDWPPLEYGTLLIEAANEIPYDRAQRFALRADVLGLVLDRPRAGNHDDGYDEQAEDDPDQPDQDDDMNGNDNDNNPPGFHPRALKWMREFNIDAQRVQEYAAPRAPSNGARSGVSIGLLSYLCLFLSRVPCLYS